MTSGARLTEVLAFSNGMAVEEGCCGHAFFSGGLDFGQPQGPFASGNEQLVIEQLTGQFEIDEQAADRDLEAFLNSLGRHKLVETEVAS